MIGKTELAQRYSPHAAPRSAWRTLKGWIDYNPALAKALGKSGYSPERRTFTPEQVKIIERFLGEP